MTANAFGRPGTVLLLAAAVVVLALLPEPGLASQGPGVSEGTAEPITQATAAAMALVTPVAVAVFAIARFLSSRG